MEQAEASGKPVDLTPGADYDVPPDQRGDAGDIEFSPDGKEICFTAVTDPVEAISTNGDLFLVPDCGRVRAEKDHHAIRDSTEIPFILRMESTSRTTRS